MRVTADPRQQSRRGESAECYDLGPAVPVNAIVAMVAGLGAAWLAAGSTGLLAHPLRHALTWLALAVALVALWPDRRQPPASWWSLAAAVALALIASASMLPLVDVLAVALVLAALARMQDGACGRVVRLTALAVAVLGIYRLAYTSIAVVWMLAGAAGHGLGWLAGTISGRPLWVNATLGGIDFLVLMAAVYGGWLAWTEPPRRPRAVYAAAAILGGHLVYLVVLGFSNDLAALLPAAAPPVESELEQTPVWQWADAIRTLLPWNVPLLAAIIHAAIAALMFRWAAWLPVPNPKASPAGQRAASRQAQSLALDALFWLGPVLLAILVAVLVALAPVKCDLTGKTIVAYENGRLNWQKPEHDRYGQDSAGMYGMLPALVESLGGRFVISPDLSDRDLALADVLLLLQPHAPWSEQQRQGIWSFIRAGGALLLAAETKTDEVGSGTLNEILEPTAMYVRCDTAVPATGSWGHALESAVHPAAAGIGDQRDHFSLDAGSSIQMRWPARPILVGCWGFSDPGRDAALTGSSRYDGGEMLGDLVLAAQQRVGKGTIAVLGDVSCLTNQGSVNSYVFTGRLLAYLAAKADSPQAWWRQLLGLLAGILLVALLGWRPDMLRLAAGVIVLGGSLACCTAATHWASRVLPDGRKHKPNNVAYIDASHLEAHSGANWRDGGINGLALTLMRNGYLPLLLPELTAERLQRAGLLISIAPARQFSRDQRQAVDGFVRAGGIFIAMVGSEETAASRALLADFAFHVPASPLAPSDTARECEPMGCFRTPYINTDQLQAQVVFHAGWGIECDAKDIVKRVIGFNDQPVVIARRMGAGVVAVIGDSKFALNKNLEQADGQPIHGSRENAYFWRWFLTVLNGQEEWIPPHSDTAAEAETADEAAKMQPSGGGNAKTPDPARSGKGADDSADASSSSKVAP